MAHRDPPYDPTMSALSKALSLAQRPVTPPLACLEPEYASTMRWFGRTDDVAPKEDLSGRFTTNEEEVTVRLDNEVVRKD